MSGSNQNQNQDADNLYGMVPFEAMLLYECVNPVSAYTSQAGNGQGSITIRDGTIDELLDSIELVKQQIPKKNGMSEEEIYDRLQGREYGIKIVERASRTIGLTVWHEEDGALYLWLGVMTERSQGIGTQVLQQIDQETHYDTWTVKIAHDNIAAKKHLGKMDFKEYLVDDGVSYLRREVNTRLLDV